MQFDCSISLCKRTTLTYMTVRADPKKHQENRPSPGDNAKIRDTITAEPGVDELSDWECDEVEDSQWIDEDLKDYGRPGRRRLAEDQPSSLFDVAPEAKTVSRENRRMLDESGRSVEKKQMKSKIAKHENVL